MAAFTLKGLFLVFLTRLFTVPIFFKLFKVDLFDRATCFFDRVARICQKNQMIFVSVRLAVFVLETKLYFSIV